VAGVYAWHWRVLLPASSAIELIAFVIFFANVTRHKRQAGTDGKRKRETWMRLILGGTIGLFLTLLAGLIGSLIAARSSQSPELSRAFDQRYLVLLAWGFIVPNVWGFSAKWLPIFLGLKPVRNQVVGVAFAFSTAGVLIGVIGYAQVATVLLFTAAMLTTLALRLFERCEQPAKTQGVHSSFPAFTRIAYVWLCTAAAIGMWGATAPGVAGAGRHALTVGFVATMVLCIGQRVLPAFSGMKLLFSTRLMFCCLALLNAGCLLRVASEILAYQHYAGWAWSVLPISAVVELAALSIFALNLVLTFARPPEHVVRFQTSS
jgi:hypothetical protein